MGSYAPSNSSLQNSCTSETASKHPDFENAIQCRLIGRRLSVKLSFFLIFFNFLFLVPKKERAAWKKML
jgi:hypothetical protein